jgi:TM2 domain-containing membrane protein YozV
MAFCTKCGFEFPDDARFCPKCGMVNLLAAASAEPAPAAPADVEKRGTTLFWLCFFFGFLGVHQFYSGNARRGIFYLLMSTLCGFLIIPLIVIGVLVVIDLWRISHGTFRSGNGVRYQPANLFIVWVICTALGAFLLLHSCHGTFESGAFSPRIFGGGGGSELGRAAQNYTESESAYIQKSHSAGSWKDIGYVQNATELFAYSDHLSEGSGEGFRAELKRKLGNCPAGAAWHIFVSVGADGKVNFQPVLPSDPRCKDAVRDFMRNR